MQRLVNGELVDMTADEIAEHIADQASLTLAAATFIPRITKVQALLWLLSIGKTEADVEAAIAAIPDPQAKAVADILWKYKQPFERSHPLFDQLAPALGLTSAQLDDGFRAAALL